jgi:hypothetical protein
MLTSTSNILKLGINFKSLNIMYEQLGYVSRIMNLENSPLIKIKMSRSV